MYLHYSTCRNLFNNKKKNTFYKTFIIRFTLIHTNTPFPRSYIPLHMNNVNIICKMFKKKQYLITFMLRNLMLNE